MKILAELGRGGGMLHCFMGCPAIIADPLRMPFIYHSSQSLIYWASDLMFNQVKILQLVIYTWFSCKSILSSNAAKLHPANKRIVFSGMRVTTLS